MAFAFRIRACAMVMLMTAVNHATCFNSNIPLLRTALHRPARFSMQHSPENGPENPFRTPIRRASKLPDPSTFYTNLNCAPDGSVKEREDMDLDAEFKGYEGYAVLGNEAVVQDSEGDEVSIKSARLMILLAALLCGTNFGAIKALQEGGLEPSILLATRFVLAGVAMSPLLAKTNPKCVMASAETGVWLALGYIFQAVALQTTAAGTTAFLCSLTTVVCPVIEKLTGVRVTMQAWAAALTAVAGAAFLELNGDEVPGMGDLFALMQPISFGYFFFRTEQIMQDFPDQALPITTIQVVVCALLGCLWTVWDAHGLPDLTHLTSHLNEPVFDFALVWIGLVSTALILVLETIALGKLPSSETAVVFSSEPLWGAGFASVLIGEKIGMNTVVGGSLIIGACIGRVVDIDRVRRQAKVVRRKAARTLSTLTVKR